MYTVTRRTREVSSAHVWGVRGGGGSSKEKDSEAKEFGQRGAETGLGAAGESSVWWEDPGRGRGGPESRAGLGLEGCASCLCCAAASP